MDDEQQEPRYATFSEREERDRVRSETQKRADREAHRKLVIRVLVVLAGAALALLVLIAVLAGGDDDDDDEDDDSMGSQPVPVLIA